MNSEKYNINISIDESSIQLCIDDKFYKIVNSSSSKDEFQMVGLQIMDMVDSLDDILKFREVKVQRLDDVMKRKMTAFSQLLANSVLPAMRKTDTQLEKFVKTKVAQQTFKAIAMRQDDIKTKTVERTLSKCVEEQEERLKLKNKEIDYTDDEQLEAAVQKLYGNKEKVKQPVNIVKELKIDIKPTVKEVKPVEDKKVTEPKETIAENIKKEATTKPEYTFDQQYLIDAYVKMFGKNKVSRSQYYEEGGSRRFIKLFGGYTNFVTAAIA